MATKPRKLRVLELRWVDSEVFGGWTNSKSIKDTNAISVVSVGLEVESTGEHVTLAVGFDKRNNNFVAAVKIPRCSITKVRVIGKLEA